MQLKEAACFRRCGRAVGQHVEHVKAPAEFGLRIADLARPTRVEIIRAKQRILGRLSDGLPHRSGELLGEVAEMLGTTPLGYFEIELPDRRSGMDVLRADHPGIASLHGDAVAREALAELAASGMSIAVGGMEPAPPSPFRVGYKVPGYGSFIEVEMTRPAVLSDIVRLPHRLREKGLWGLEPDVFVDDLASLELDPRTSRSLQEAIESYRRGVFLAAASLLGAAVEGAWYAAAQRLRSTVPAVDRLVDGDRTARLQSAVTTALREKLPNSRVWEADSLSQFAGLMRGIRNTVFTHGNRVTKALRSTSRRTLWAPVP